MPLGIDDDYDGEPNESDSTPEGKSRIQQLMAELAALLGNNAPAEAPVAPAPMAPAPAGQDGGLMQLMELLKQLTGGNAAPAPEAPMPPAGLEAAAPAGPPAVEGEEMEDDSEGAPEDEAPKNDKAKASMAKLKAARAGK
jgi:hypothetical protein